MDKSITIRRAEDRDIPKILEFLHEVLEVHAKLRRDIFIPGTTKYTAKQLSAMLRDDRTPVFVAVGDDGVPVGSLFGVVQSQPFTTTMRQFKTLYIDDLTVDEASRGQHVGKRLYEHALDYARSIGCYDVTLNVWEGNDAARAFYDKMGMFVKETQLETIL